MDGRADGNQKQYKCFPNMFWKYMRKYEEDDSFVALEASKPLLHFLIRFMRLLYFWSQIAHISPPAGIKKDKNRSMRLNAISRLW